MYLANSSYKIDWYLYRILLSVIYSIVRISILIVSYFLFNFLDYRWNKHWPEDFMIYFTTFLEKSPNFG